MDVKLAARAMLPLVQKAKGLPEINPEIGRDHLTRMCLDIMDGNIINEKAHRWLGWAQGCVCVGGGARLETLKLVNKYSKSV